MVFGLGGLIFIAIVLFVLGNIMALKPSAKEVRLDKLRMLARQVGLQPKLVASPSWVIGSMTNPSQEKGKGMIAQYGLIVENAKMIACDYQVIDGEWRPYTAHHPANFVLDKMAVDFPPSIAPFVQGLSFKANFVCIYWQENTQMPPKKLLATMQSDLSQLKSQLQQLVVLVQNSQPSHLTQA